MYKLLFIVLCAAAQVASAHDVITTKLTWSAEISRIVFRRCVSCHRDGGAAPMSLTTYETARPWAKAIRDQVLNRTMPPWGAVRGYGSVKHDESLTEEEMMRIAEWVEGGAPEGDPRYLPPVPPPAVSQAGQRVAARRLQTTRISAPITLLGIRPLVDAESAKLRAVLPDGREEPLLWLMGYKAKWNRTFWLAEAMRLPAGTKLVAEPSVRVELLVR